MGKAPGRWLKVFVAQIGFYDTVVAVPSQAAALKGHDFSFAEIDCLGCVRMHRRLSMAAEACSGTSHRVASFL